MTIEQELEAALARIAELEPKATALDAAQTQAQKNFAELQAAASKSAKTDDLLKKALEDAAAQKERADKAEAEVAALKLDKEGEPARITAAINAAQASLGIPEPVSQPVDNKPTATVKPDLSKLTGLDKAIAAHKLSTAK